MDFIFRWGYPQIFEWMRPSLDPRVWNDIILPGETQNNSILSQVPEENLPREDGWYLIILTRRDGTLAWFRFYIGQAARDDGGVRERCLREHKSNVLPGRKQSLLYFIWRGGVTVKSGMSLDDLPIKAKIICLGTDKSSLTGADKQQFMNIGEIFLALTFTSLQTNHLRYWLPGNASLPAEPIGLNVALPLWQGHRDEAVRAASKLAKSADPAVRE